MSDIVEHQLREFARHYPSPVLDDTLAEIARLRAERDGLRDRMEVIHRRSYPDRMTFDELMKGMLSINDLARAALSAPVPADAGNGWRDEIKCMKGSDENNGYSASAPCGSHNAVSVDKG